MTNTPNPHRLSHTQLTRHTNPDTLPKSSKARLPAPAICFGQNRAYQAIKTALDIRGNGYHVFAVGENGLGKRSMILRLLKERAKLEPTPDDWVYVHNFKQIRKPIGIRFDAGMAVVFEQKVHKLWQDAKKRLCAKLLGDNHQKQVEQAKAIINTTQSQEYQHLDNIAKQQGLRLTVHRDGMVDFVVNDDIDTQAIQAIKDKLFQQLSKIHVKLEELENKTHDKLDKLHQTVALGVLEPLFKPVMAEFQDYPSAVAHLAAMRDDMLYHVSHIINEDNDEFVNGTLSPVPSRYTVNVITSHEPKSGAPIVFEDLPTHLNLLGHIEYTTELGTVLTDVSMIRSGALHRANGGYLLLQANHLLEHPYAWQGLKRALQSHQIRISSLEQMLTLTGSLSLEPDSIPLNVKVILLGEPDLYYELLEFEPEFNTVFKVRADFSDTIKRDADSEYALVLQMVDIIKAQGLPHFDRTAFACILDELSRLTEDQDKLDLHIDRLTQLLLESARQATLANSDMVADTHVKAALSDLKQRHGYLQELYWQELKDGQQIIITQGQAVGQINALTVISYADSEFGMPARLTALIQPNFGDGEILDIERDVELGGSLHAKGMLIMSSHLRALFSEFCQMNFSASLAFEQSYAHIDGDSATLAEACVLFSALADVPIKQSLAITGSMNQLGQAQAIGGVNEKITGFFDACQEQGLTGDQGVIIPRANIRQLMLGDDIINAVENGRFHIYAIDHINDALRLLTDIDINDKNKKGDYKKNTLFGKIVQRLSRWQDDDKGKNS